MQQVQSILVYALVAMAGLIVIGILTIIARLGENKRFLFLSRPSISYNFDDKKITEFADTRHGRDIAAEYDDRITRLTKRRNKLETKALKNHKNQSKAVSFWKRSSRIDKKITALSGQREKELGLGSRMYGSHRGPRLQGDSIKHGIGREGHGHRGFAPPKTKKEPTRREKRKNGK